MIAPRLLSKQTVTKRLKAEGCTRIEPEVIPDHSYWRTASGFYFYVPELGPDHMTPEIAFLEILADVLKANGSE